MKTYKEKLENMNREKIQELYKNTFVCNADYVEFASTADLIKELDAAHQSDFDDFLGCYSGNVEKQIENEMYI